MSLKTAVNLEQNDWKRLMNCVFYTLMLHFGLVFVQTGRKKNHLFGFCFFYRDWTLDFPSFPSSWAEVKLAIKKQWTIKYNLNPLQEKHIQREYFYTVSHMLGFITFKSLNTPFCFFVTFSCWAKHNKGVLVLAVRRLPAYFLMGMWGGFSHMQSPDHSWLDTTKNTLLLISKLT